MSLQGTPRGSQSKQGSSQGAPMVALCSFCTADCDFFFLPFKICAVTCSMCSYTQTNIKRKKYVLCCAVLCCMSLFMLPASVSGNVTSLPLSLFTVAHFWEATTSVCTHTHTQSSKHVGPPCLCVYVCWLSHNL